MNSIFQYSAAGNTVSAGAQSFSYDARGRLVGAATALGSVSYQLNALGQRVAKQTPQAATHFHYDAEGRLIAESDAQGSFTREYLWLGTQPVAVIVGGTLHYLYADHLDTPRVVTNAANAIVWRWDADPFRAAAPDEDPDGDANRFDFNLRFPGQYYDRKPICSTTTSAITIRRRDGKCRAIRSRLDGGLNTYLYAEANPLAFTDPSGLDAYRCRRTISRKPGEEPLYGRATQHWYSCVISPDGQQTCGGQTMTGSAAGSPGRPTTEKEDYYDPKASQPSEKGNDCFDKCLKDECQKPRPRYSVIWGRGTHCQEYDNDVNSICRKQCGLKVP